MFVHDSVICNENKEPAEESLEKWRHAHERAMKAIRSISEYMCVFERKVTARDQWWMLGGTLLDRREERGANKKTGSEGKGGERRE